MRLFYFAIEDLSRPDVSPGAVVHVSEIVRRLPALGWDVTLFSVRSRESGRQPEFDFPHYLTYRESGSVRHQMFQQMRLARQMAGWSGPKPDVVYGRSGPSMLVPYVYALGHAIPYFIEVNGAFEFTTRNPALMPAVVALENTWYRRARAVIPCSISLRDNIVRRTGLRLSKFEVIPPGFGEHLLSVPLEQETPQGRPTVGFIGAFDERQGVQTLIEAAPRLREMLPEARILIAGGGHQEGHYRAMIEQLGVGDCVEIVGFIPNAEMGGFFEQCQVLVAPYFKKFRREVPMGAPTKIFNYLAAGRPAVTTDLPTNDPFRPCPALKFAEPDDPVTLADRMAELLRLPPAERRSLGRRGREFVENRYTWDCLAQRTSDVIRQRIARR